MKVGSGKGAWKKKLHQKNRKRIVAWFEKNPGGFKSGCAKALGLSYRTVLNHLKEIERGK